jgi:hypothetical protein
LFDHGGLPLGDVCSVAAVVAAKAAPEEVGDVSAILNAVWPRLPRPAQPSGLAWSHPKISLLREFVLRAQANFTSHPPDRVSSPFLYAIHIAQLLSQQGHRLSERIDPVGEEPFILFASLKRTHTLILRIAE